MVTIISHELKQSDDDATRKLFGQNWQSADF